MNKRPVIGITPSRSEENRQVLLKETNIQSVYRAGGLPVVLPVLPNETDIEALLDQVDGILLSGGVDVNPKNYGEDPLPACGTSDDVRDAFELTLTRRAIERGMPVFGICRGVQVLSVALGATLFQDLESQLGISRATHKQEPPYEMPVHTVRLKEGGLLARVTGVTTVPTNSMHHQSIKDAGDQIRIEGITMDGIVEAISMVGREDVFGVQFHPEYLSKEGSPSARLFEYLVSNARAYCDKE